MFSQLDAAVHWCALGRYFGSNAECPSEAAPAGPGVLGVVARGLLVPKLKAGARGVVG